MGGLPAPFGLEPLVSWGLAMLLMERETAVGPAEELPGFGRSPVTGGLAGSTVGKLSPRDLSSLAGGIGVRGLDEDGDEAKADEGGAGGAS